MDRDTFGAILKQLGIRLSVLQWAVISSKYLYNLVSGGVRAGKSFQSALMLVLRIVATIYDGSAKPGDVYWLIGKSYAMTSEEFKYTKAFLRALGFLGFSTQQADAPGRIELNVCPCGEGDCGHDKITVYCKTASDDEAIAAQAPRGIVVCEAGQITLEQYWRIEERLIEHGGWLLLVGTMEYGIGWFADRLDVWANPVAQERDNAMSHLLPSYSNLHVFPGGEKDPKILRFKSMHTKDWFENRIEAKRIKPQGVVFPEFNTIVHLKKLAYDPKYPVYVCADPGYSRATESAYAVECFQHIDGQIRVFDEIYVQEHGARAVARIAKNRPWWSNAEKLGYIDQGGIQHHTGESHTDIWLEENGLVMRHMPVGIMDGIDRMRDLLMPDPILNQPAIVLGANCIGVISEFGGGLNPFTQREQIYMWPRGTDGTVKGRNPIDKYNHGIKALTYGIVNAFGFGQELGELAASVPKGPGSGSVRYW